ncbi:response regulator [Mesonia sp.]|uniref:response regulator n=2 Tax=Mesonia sp. TaxID=1960830 RepID=UPI003F9C091A
MMDTLNPKDNSQQKKLQHQFNSLKKRYEDVFDFLVLSVASMTNMAASTITLFDKNEVFVVSTNDASIQKIGLLNPPINDTSVIRKTNLNEPYHPIKKFEVKFCASFPIMDSQGVIIGSLNVFDDKKRVLTEAENATFQNCVLQINRWITSKEKEQRLEKHDNLFELSNDLIGISSFEGKFIKINPVFSKTLGWTAAEFRETPFIDFVHPEDVEETIVVMRKLRRGKSVVNFTNRYKTKHDGIKWIEWTCAPETETKLIFVIGRDVTQFVEREQLLKKSERKYHNLFDNLQGILSVHDLEGNLIEVNRAGLKNTGFSKEEMHQSTLFDLIAPERHEEIKAYLQAIQKYNQAEGEMSIIKKNGEKAIWYFMSTIAEDTEGNKQVLANVIDITDRKKLDNELKKAKEDAEQAYLAKSEFIANMSHEIRTPLNGIIGFTELALTTNLSDTQKQYLEIINQSGVSLYSIINDILDFSKMQSKNMKLVIDKIEVEEVIAEAFNIVAYGIDKKGLEMLIDTSHDIPRYIWADAMRLKQILVNLLGNALKFTEIGEITLYVKTVKDYKNGKMKLRFGVRDTGIGIHKDKQQEIFQAFSQEDGSITKKYGGTGLGLTISNKLLALANSELHLESEQGKGSDFYFDLDFKVNHEEVDIALEEIKRVLIVDDNRNNRKILRRMLERKGIEVEEADSGLKALLIMSDHQAFDVIIMDYHMPIMDGIETIRKIKGMPPRENSEQPFIVLYSSSDDDQLQLACDELEIKNRLVKPIRMNQMYQVLAELRYFQEPKSPIQEQASTQSTKTGLKILIAEDYEINMLLNKTFLKELVPEVIIIEASDGTEAVSEFKKESPDIILMDIQMPNLNGLEATKQIRSIEKDVEIPIIALTAGSLPGEKEKCLQAGMTDFLTKPLLKQSLSDMLHKWLGKEINN